MRRATVLVVGVAALTLTGVAAAGWLSRPQGPKVVVGTVDDFPPGSITPLTVKARLTAYVPRISDTSPTDMVTVPVLLVNDPVEGFLALYASDPHLGCRVLLATQMENDIGRDLPADVTFITPCHGEKYDRWGRYLAGPAPRGLDRLGVLVKDANVVIDVAAFEYGPERDPARSE